MNKVFLRSEFNYDTNEVSLNTGLVCTEPTRTQQQFKDEVDINTIVKRFGLTGQLPTSLRPPMAGDFTGINDYQSAMNALIEADSTFMQLPADVRKRFDNDPSLFVDFALNPENLDEMRSMGLAVPKAEPAAPAGDNLEPASA